jgi:hypothetical protein
LMPALGLAVGRQRPHFEIFLVIAQFTQTKTLPPVIHYGDNPFEPTFWVPAFRRLLESDLVGPDLQFGSDPNPSPKPPPPSSLPRQRWT